MEKTKSLIIRIDCLGKFVKNLEESKQEKEMWRMNCHCLISCHAEFSFGIRMMNLMHNYKFLWTKMCLSLSDMKLCGMRCPI